MNRGFYLSILVGAVNPQPVPQVVIESLIQAEINSSVGSQSGFQLTFTLGKNSALQGLINSGYFDPRTRVIIVVTVNGTPNVLMDGIITKQDVTPSDKPGQSTLSVTGLDLTALMDFIDLTGIPYPALPTFAIVAVVLAKYAIFGVVPVPIPNPITFIETPIEKIRRQKGTDYHYVKLLAEKAGTIFYLEPGPKPGMSVAYWGPDLTKYGSPQPALSIDLDSASNIEGVSFSYDGLLSAQYIATILEEKSHFPIPIPIPNIDILKASLSQKAPVPLKSKVIKNIANKKPMEAVMLVLGALVASSDAITANGQLDVLRYGHIFKARQLAAVRGAGRYYDGTYYVKNVTHSIKRGEYKQSFSMARGGVVSSVDTVSV
jgi:hypothetical protein